MHRLLSFRQTLHQSGKAGVTVTGHPVCCKSLTITPKVCVDFFRRFRLHVLFDFRKMLWRQRKIVGPYGPEQKTAVKVDLFFCAGKLHDFHIHFAEYAAYRRFLRFSCFGPVTVLQCDAFFFIIRERKIRQTVDELIQADYICGRTVLPDNDAAGFTNGNYGIVPARQRFMPRPTSTDYAHPFRNHKVFYLFRSFRAQFCKIAAWKIVSHNASPFSCRTTQMSQSIVS